MAHSYHHALSSARQWGGVPGDYQAIHDWFDQTKAHIADPRHRLILHNSFGIFLAEQVFGVTIVNAAGRAVPVRAIAELHVREDFRGEIPSLADIIDLFPLQPWMGQRSGPLTEDDLPLPPEVQTPLSEAAPVHRAVSDAAAQAQAVVALVGRWMDSVEASQGHTSPLDAPQGTDSGHDDAGAQAPDQGGA